MKSHPDTANRPAVEAVTQLPVPSRLGLLRFERLNEPSWTLLFLDPACERAFGVAAAELCGLLDAPYASLMEPEARHRLHELIQQQLLEHAHYQVRYSLHTPRGVLNLLEVGEAFQQRGRQLLHGYLLQDEEGARQASQGELAEQNLRLQMSLEMYQRSQDEHLQHLVRSRAQQNLIVRLARHRYQSSDPLLEAAQLIAQAASEAYDVARAGIWRLTRDNHMEPVAVYRRDIDQFELPRGFDASRYPNYLDAINSGRAIDAHNVLQDPRTRELAEAYLRPQGISAMLDATIRVGGEVVGVLCLEHIGEVRLWQSDEIAFAGELADQYAQVLMNHERRSASSALHLFQRAVEQSANAFLLIDRDGVIEYVNPSFTAITQYGADEVRGRRLAEVPALANLSELLFDARSTLVNQNSWQGEFRSRRKNLEPYWGQLSLSKVYADDGELTHYIGIYEDITQSKLAQQHIEKLAYRDNLTGLANRHYFINVLEERLRAGSGPPLGLLLVDIDNFKRINDSLGHQTGDKLLASLARRLRSSLVDGTTLARFASNEFAVLLEESSPGRGERVAAQILDVLDKPLFVDNQLINITGSIGLAYAPQHGQDPQTLMKNAGLALHKAKANGKHQLQTFTEEMTAEASHKLFVESNLRRALVQNELAVHYQPKLCLRSGQLLGLEALLRWQHPEKGMIRPDQFISVAEETGLIIPIGKWVIREACRMGRELAETGLGDLNIAINLSPKQFSDPDLVGSIAAILHEEQVPAGRLELELTESLLLDATADTKQQLERLKQLGLTLAMDDFGTGYSSLSYLKKFPIDVIKIDRSFIKDIPDNQDDMEITSAVIAMAHNLKLQVVAEGVETAAQLAFLRRNRCDIGQGYLFDKPIPGALLASSLQRYPCRGD
ncbi:diguanylate cyclase/phosphodiesterase with PAS/PAC and GAF sensor(s) [Pseudomonas delhiensis]|uniref:cyclic-guanylate-specific phosphodiesterase n=1 Tax=Pseudomonas delhiensis TaxID=366289 RepID=A0A239ERD1_9PSED|nr:GGDEF and EAL domain-containing protein [Pseudomonas delhiensis]SDI56725.1 diguanylate cyclase/phosphodiesterase with PAS/PAC and GAF sensor(s) [Pseudomonas delhiensis]SNS47195.1 diguanylate cyclase/phosphodiesterase with PAS/PAC and GAF sensor(s) [Pseudomonas delhiensis]